jgi:hypothetical protein
MTAISFVSPARCHRRSNVGLTTQAVGLPCSRLPPHPHTKKIACRILCCASASNGDTATHKKTHEANETHATLTKKAWTHCRTLNFCSKEKLVGQVCQNSSHSRRGANGEPDEEESECVPMKCGETLLAVQTTTWACAQHCEPQGQRVMQRKGARTEKQVAHLRDHAPIATSTASSRGRRRNLIEGRRRTTTRSKGGFCEGLDKERKVHKSRRRRV